MRRRFNVDCHPGRTGTCEALEIFLGLSHHHVNIERKRCELPYRCDHLFAERDVRYEAPVHDVEMDQVSAAIDAHCDVVGESGEISAEYRRSYPRVHRAAPEAVGERLTESTR